MSSATQSISSSPGLVSYLFYPILLLVLLAIGLIGKRALRKRGLSTSGGSLLLDYKKFWLCLKNEYDISQAYLFIGKVGGN